MAIARIKKVEIIALEQEKEKLLSAMQELGAIQLIAPQEQGSFNDKFNEAELLEIEEAVSFLSTFKESTPFFESLIPIKPVVYKNDVENIIRDFDRSNFLKELRDRRSRLKELIQRKEVMDEERRILAPWRKLHIGMDEFHSTKNCGISLSTFYTRDYKKILEELLRGGVSPFIEIVNQDKINTYAVFIYIKEDLEKIENILKNYHFGFVVLGRHERTVKERLFEINLELMICDDEIEEAKSEITRFLTNQFKLMAVYDYLWTGRKREEAVKNLTPQRFTFTVSGWMKERDLPLLEKILNKEFDNVAVFISDPKAGEEVPVDLENPKWLQPFEFITKIYGFPRYSEVDPTPYLAPFFFLYFGFCVSDAAYGFILALLSYYMLKRIRLGPQGVRAFKLFFYCGISTIIIGALTGSWFGNLFDLLAGSNKIFLPIKRFKDSLVMLDPVKEPAKLLAITISFGVIQVWFGNIVAAIGNLKNRRYMDVLFDQATMLIFLFGLTGLALVFLRMIGAGNAQIFKYAALLGGGGLIATQGRSEKGINQKLFYGAYNLYSAISGYLSDILSYSRLWALGLVTGVMATTINLISVQFSQIVVSAIPFIDKVAAVRIILSMAVLSAIFVCGHLISFFMNLLGAFVHPVRLQFVEFFSKFFKTSGHSFKPFRVETKYVEIK